MEEDFMTTTRNGHDRKDMYNPETNTLDIRSNGLYPSNVRATCAATDSVLTGWCAAAWRDSCNITAKWCISMTSIGWMRIR